MHNLAHWIWETLRKDKVGKKGSVTKMGNARPIRNKMLCCNWSKTKIQHTFFSIFKWRKFYYRRNIILGSEKKKNYFNSIFWFNLKVTIHSKCGTWEKTRTHKKIIPQNRGHANYTERWMPRLEPRTLLLWGSNAYH